MWFLCKAQWWADADIATAPWAWAFFMGALKEGNNYATDRWLSDVRIIRCAGLESVIKPDGNSLRDGFEAAGMIERFNDGWRATTKAWEGQIDDERKRERDRVNIANKRAIEKAMSRDVAATIGDVAANRHGSPDVGASRVLTLTYTETPTTTEPQQDQQDVETAPVEAPPTPAAPPARPLVDPRLAEVYDFWATTMRKSGVALKKTTAAGKKRIAAVKARLADGYTVEQIKAAVTACAASEFHNGGNESGQSYNDLTLICRADKIDKFLDRKNGTPASGERPKFNGAHQPSRPGPYRSPLPVAQPEEVPEGEI
jgi:hypothetical protein